MFFAIYLPENHLGVFSTGRLVAVARDFYFRPKRRKQRFRHRNCFSNLSVFE